MLKKINKEELLSVFKSEIPGAMIISRNSYLFDCYVTPAILGIKTYIGCVEFGPGDDHESYDQCGYVGNWFTTSQQECKAIYFDVPQDGTAWLVVPKENHYEWQRIDHLLRFQNEDEEYCDEDSRYGCGPDDLDEFYLKRHNLCVGEHI